MKKVSFIFIFILCLCCSSVFAGENLTINEFRELCNVPEDVDISTDLQNILLTSNPFIISSKDEKYIYIYPMKKTYDVLTNDISNFVWRKRFCFKCNKNGSSSYFYFIPDFDNFSNPYGNTTQYTYIYDVENKTFSTKNWVECKQKYYIRTAEGSQFGFNIDVNSETVEYFSSLNNLKNYLEDHLLFNGWDGTIYYNDSNVLYKFDGVYVGRGDNITGTTMWSNDDVGFSYTNTYSENSTLFYLQDVPLTEITEWSANNFNTLLSKYNTEYIVKTFNNGTGINSLENCSSYEVTYQNLAKKLEQGHIYRLYACSIVDSYNSSRRI